MIFYVGNLKNSENFLELIEFIILGCEVDIKISILFLTIHNEQMEFKKNK